MGKRTVDKTKKSNVKCEHCENWTGYIDNEAHCKLDNQEKLITKDVSSSNGSV